MSPGDIEEGLLAAERAELLRLAGAREKAHGHVDAAKQHLALVHLNVGRRLRDAGVERAETVRVLTPLMQAQQELVTALDELRPTGAPPHEPGDVIDLRTRERR